MAVVRLPQRKPMRGPRLTAKFCTVRDFAEVFETSNTERARVAVVRRALVELQEAAAESRWHGRAPRSCSPRPRRPRAFPRLERMLLLAGRTGGAGPAFARGGRSEVRKPGGKPASGPCSRASCSSRRGRPPPRAAGRGRVALALAAELVHSATLLHDDVIDDGLTRRGLPAPRVAYGNGVSVLAGDWMLTTSLDLAFRSRVPEAPQTPLVKTLRQLVEGEARQLRPARVGGLHRRRRAAHRPAQDRLALRLGGGGGALVARAPPNRPARRSRSFGLHSRHGLPDRGLDLLDFEADSATLGKAVLADVTEGEAFAAAGHRPEAAAGPARGDGRAARSGGRAEGGRDASLGEHEDLLRARIKAFAVKLSRTGALGAARRIAEKER